MKNSQEAEIKTKESFKISIIRKLSMLIQRYLYKIKKLNNKCKLY
jgi:hypothetical protein